jgi:hypothetical protein
MEHDEYPKIQYHDNGETRVVNSRAEESGKGWNAHPKRNSGGDIVARKPPVHVVDVEQVQDNVEQAQDNK